MICIQMDMPMACIDIDTRCSLADTCPAYQGDMENASYDEYMRHVFCRRHPDCPIKASTDEKLSKAILLCPKDSDGSIKYEDLLHVMQGNI